MPVWASTTSSHASSELRRTLGRVGLGGTAATSLPPRAPEAPAQLLLYDLAHGVARQRRDDLELLGNLLHHDTAADHEGAHLVERRGKSFARTQDEAGTHALTASRVWDADHRGLGDPRMLVQLVLDRL